jgi:antitoxin component YwqK of YwqJK toxin-antitoxin module
MKSKTHTVYHKDGSVWAVGHLKDGATTGYWEWFRKDGTKSRSGHFDNGHQVGEWTTYDKDGNPHKVTKMKPKDTSQSIAFTGCSE